METGPSEHVEIRRIFIYLFQFIKAEFVHLDVASSLPPLPRACGFTDEDKHIRNDFLFKAWFTIESSTNLLLSDMRQSNRFPSKSNLGPQPAKCSTKAANLVGDGRFFCLQ